MGKILACATADECAAFDAGWKNLPTEDDTRHYNGCQPVENNCDVCPYRNADGSCGY